MPTPNSPETPAVEKAGTESADGVRGFCASLFRRVRTYRFALAGGESERNYGGAPVALGELIASIPLKHWLIYFAAAAGWGLLVFLTTWDQGINWVTGWHRWDANWYEQIWKDGWGNDPHTLAFMPVFAWLSGALAGLLGGHFDLSSLVLNVACFFFAGVISSEYVARRTQVSKWTLYAFHLCSPVAFYAFMPYSDALFYLLFWVVLIAAENSPLLPKSRSEFAAECLFMFCMPFVRMTSFALAVWLLFRRWYAAAVFATLALILLLNWKITSEPLYFLRVQEEFAMPKGWFIDGLWQAAWKDLTSTRTMSYREFWLQVSVLPVLSTILILIAAVWLKLRREYFFLATMLAIAFMSRNQAFWRSVLRYDLPLTALIAAPWIAWARPFAEGGWFRRWLKPALAALMIGVLLGVGLYLQLSVGHRLHQGGWGY